MVNFRRTLLPFFVLILCFMAVGIRLFFIQVWHHEELDKRVQKLVFRERPEQPCRGMILDRDGKILAMSIKNYTLFVDPRTVEDARAVESSLQKFGIAIRAKEIEQAKDTSYMVVARGLGADTMRAIKALALRGVGLQQEYRRQYPEGRMASQVIGIVGKDGSGLVGVELEANGFLTGEKVREVKYRDGRGREISEKFVNLKEMRGADVYLTIDATLQFIAEQEIDRALKESSARRAMVVIQDPNTGEILAMASKPDFDPSGFAGAADRLTNPIISDVFEPGSTFKLVAAAAALEEKTVKPSEVIWCEEGKYAVFGHTISDHEKKGFLNLDGIIECSSNIGMAKIGMRLGKNTLYKYIRQFGFYSKTGIGLPGEVKGLLKSPEEWSGLSLPVISFGQEIGVTALQLINAYSAIANEGSLLEPRIVREIRNSRGESLAGPERRVIRKVVSPGVAREVKDMLRGVVEKGTGQLARVPGYSVGGKTGTAQKRDPRTGRYSTSNYVASFCGIIPLSRPRLTIFVVLDEPKGDYWASSRAAPIFSRIASRTMHHLRIPPDLETIRLAATKGRADGKKIQ